MPESLPILYSFRRCPYAMRARLALYSAKTPHEHREITLKNKPKEMLEISPKGTVPVLQINKTDVLEQSLDIMNWVLKSPSLSESNNALIRGNDTTFKHALDRYKYPGRYPEDSNIDYREVCQQFLLKLEENLSPFLEGQELGFTDMAILPFVRQFSMVDPDWFFQQPYPKVIAWLNSFTSSKLFDKIMQKHPLWTSDSPPCLIHEFIF